MKSLDTYSHSLSPTISMTNSPSAQQSTVPYKKAQKRKTTSTTASIMDEDCRSWRMIRNVGQKPHSVITENEVFIKIRISNGGAESTDKIS
ncbi:hypothetical protein PoB_004163400 [Plakobranchus ocellatus]|uniref:Uncharacterized protein n=1 Tax=Plakobranchus ocellatus TaxID=259542 RepID=A0AAV4B8V8_9GAST|nr:hypothetical protein PoB_004163400 [Plakobranchus ocellatus]